MSVESIDGVKVSLTFNKQGKNLGNVTFVGHNVNQAADERVKISSSGGNSISLGVADLIEGRQCSYYQGPIIHERITRNDEGVSFSNSEGEIVKKVSFENNKEYKALLDRLAKGLL